MADFEAPSFSLGLDFDLFDSEPQTSPLIHDIDPSSSNQPPVAFATFEDNDADFETLVVDDSEPEYPDSHPKLKRLRRGLTMRATSSSSPAELHSSAVIDDEDINVFSSQEDMRTDQHCTRSNLSFNTPEALTNQHVKRNQIASDALKDFPKAYHYFFHDDPRIKELVRTRLPYFSPLGNMLNTDLDQPCTSKIDYIGQFRLAESSKQAYRTIKDKKSSRKLKNEEMSQGWVNPKLGVDKVTTKRAVKRTVHTVGHWLTGSDGKKVYVGKSGRELSGRVAYMQYKRESGSGFRQVKRKSGTKKKR